jgi:mono/diheme cytochrome c family protein
VVDRVTHGQGAMPSFADSLSEQEIADVAAYVSESTR